MKRRKLERYLREQDCRKLDEGGNHTRWAAPGGQRSAVPRHSEIDWTLARDICKQLGLSPPTGER